MLVITFIADITNNKVYVSDIIKTDDSVDIRETHLGVTDWCHSLYHRLAAVVVVVYRHFVSLFLLEESDDTLPD